jgi:hypothetical protein
MKSRRLVARWDLPLFESIFSIVFCFVLDEIGIVYSFIDVLSGLITSSSLQNEMFSDKVLRILNSALISK